MFSNRSTTERQFRSPERKLYEKRDRFRVFIRKATKDSLTSEKRRMLIEYMDTMNREMISELLRADQVPLTPMLLRQWLSELSRGKDDEFYREMEKHHIVGKLVCCLRKCNDTETKYELVTFINNLVYYQGRCVEYFEDANTVDFCYAEIEQHSFVTSLERHYIVTLVTLVSNLAAELKNDFNWYLSDFGFCDKVTKRMIAEQVVEPDIVRHLMKIRANLLLIEGPIDEKFEQYTLDTLNNRTLGEHLYAVEYLDLLNAYLKKKRSRFVQDFSHHFPSVVETVAEYFKLKLPPYDELQTNKAAYSKAFYIKLLKLLKQLNEADNEDFLTCLEIVEEIPSKELLLWALQCPEDLISNYGLLTLSKYFSNYLSRFQPSADEVGQLALLFFGKFWLGKAAEHSLSIILELLENSKTNRNYTDKLLMLGLLGKLEEYISNQSTITSKTSLDLLAIMEKLLEFGETLPSNGNPIVRLMSSSYLVKWISTNVMNENEEVSRAADSLTEKYLRHVNNEEQTKLEQC